MLLSLFGLDVAAGGVAAFGVAAGADGEVDGEAEGGVSGADVFLQVVLVVFVKEAFVIHEEDVGGDRKGGVALVDRRSGVEEFEALLVLFVLRRRHFDHGIGEDAVEFARGERGLGVFTNLADGVEDEADGSHLFGGDAAEGGVVEEEEFGADVFLGFFDPGAAGGAGMVEVELVGDDEAGFAFLGDLPGEIAILL